MGRWDGRTPSGAWGLGWSGAGDRSGAARTAVPIQIDRLLCGNNFVEEASRQVKEGLRDVADQRANLPKHLRRVGKGGVAIIVRRVAEARGGK